MVDAVLYKLEREIDALSQDLSAGLRSLQNIITYQDRRVGELENRERSALGRLGSIETLLAERKRDGDVSREHDVDIAKLEQRLDELAKMPARVAALEKEIAKLKKGGDASQVARAHRVSLSSAAMSAALFIAVIVEQLISHLVTK